MMNASITVNPIGTFLPISIPGGLSELYLDGVLNDRRNDTTMEMDGYSVYLALKALDWTRPGGFASERKQIIDALLTRMSQCDGFFSHGAWTGSPEEIHFRFTATAVRLLLEGWQDGLCRLEDLRSVLDKHISYSETLPIGLWFLHDSLELAETRALDPSRPTSNHAWGSSLKNCMVLNTHLDTLATLVHCLNRGVIPEAEAASYLDRVRSALDALQAVLEQNRSLSWKIFSFFDSRFRELTFSLSFLPEFPKRKARGALRRTVVRLRRHIRSKVFGFQFRDGYLERDISLWGTGFEYHIVNIYDLLRVIYEMRDNVHLRNGTWPVQDWIAIVDSALDYTCRAPYSIELIASTKETGRAIYVCEAILLRLSLDESFRPPRSWVKTYCAVRRRVPPSAAILGYDPFVVSKSNFELGDIEKMRLRDGRLLIVDISAEKFTLLGKAGDE
ncbi:hypothetical protein [Rhizobium sp. LjRoot254]|uniref:hypothetical protein n=1 Tax=Rhizobium sp. LjRoot254 TaxID=3342297 RepID=UPI003ECD170B